MHDQLLLQVYHDLKRHESPTRRCIYDDLVVGFIHMLSVVSQKSMRWAWDKQNWPLWARHMKRPSYSQYMRRVQSPSLKLLLDSMSSDTLQALQQVLPPSDVKICDGKALLVGGFTSDPEARLGKAPGGWGRGYKMHAVIDSTAAIEAWRVTSLNQNESTITCDLLKQVDIRGCLVLGDGNYDSNALYQRAAEAGGRFLAPRRKPGTGIGWRKHHPDRLRAIDELEGDPEALGRQRRWRLRIEQALGHLTNLPGGLSPLPNHVRRLKRVERWVATKIYLYHLHLLTSHRQRLAA